MAKRPLNFEEWQETVHARIKGDALWQFKAYPKALFLYDLAWADCDRLMRDERGKAIARQLIRSAGSVSANVEEGFGRGYGKDYAFRLRIAIGEARETRGWYWRGRQLLSDDVLDHRLTLLDEVISLLTVNMKRMANR